MYNLIAFDMARDAVAAQFTYDEPRSTPLPVLATRPAASHTRARLAGVLHRVADAVAPATYSPAR